MSEFQAELRAITGTAKSRDGFITVTVGPGGRLLKLQLDPRIYRKPDAAKLSADITDAYARATEDAAAKASTVSHRFAPGVDPDPLLSGSPEERTKRFEFIFDQIAGAGRTDG
jgi:DNA-binding protein YbaB